MRQTLLSRRPGVAYPGGNGILDHLPADVRTAVFERGMMRSLRRGEPVFAAERQWDAVYFPVDAVVSMIALLGNGGEVEVDSMGREGVLGLHVAFDVQPIRGRAVCQLSGDALRVPGAAIRAIVRASPGFHHLLLRYALARINVLAQSAACNASHTTPQRCARWLLRARDRAGRERFDLTQDFLAMILGVRRATVTVALRELQDGGAIRVARGWIAIRDHATLERAACECYEIVRREFAAVFD